MGDALPVLGETAFDVYLNERALWRCVPAAVWNYKLGGYQVLKKWLSYREQAILKRSLKPGRSPALHGYFKTHRGDFDADERGASVKTHPKPTGRTHRFSPTDRFPPRRAIPPHRLQSLSPQSGLTLPSPKGPRRAACESMEGSRPHFPGYIRATNQKRAARLNSDWEGAGIVPTGKGLLNNPVSGYGGGRYGGSRTRKLFRQSFRLSRGVMFGGLFPPRRAHVGRRRCVCCSSASGCRCRPRRSPVRSAWSSHCACWRCPTAESIQNTR